MAGTIYSGSYMGGIVLDDPATQLPATVTGSVSNQDGDAILGTATAGWTVVNQGTIQSTGTAGYGIDLAAFGTVINGDSGATAALISGYGGVLIRSALATVANYATIEATGSKRNGVELRNGGKVTNGSAAATAALISGFRYGVYIANAAGTVTNFGTIQGGDGVVLLNGGKVTNGGATATSALIGSVYIAHAAGTVSNFGTIHGGEGVALLGGGRVINGSAAATGALISGVRYGVYIARDAGTVANFGTIDGVGTVSNYGPLDGNGVVLRAGGRVTNGSATSTSALVSGVRYGVYIADAAGTVSNFGTIYGSEGSVRLTSGGRVTNGSAASTNALMSGVRVDGAAGTVTNFGTIDFLGVTLDAGGTVTNFGTICSPGGGSYYGIYGGVYRGFTLFLNGGKVTNGSATSTSALIYGVTGAGTVTNFGTIDGLGVSLPAGGRVINGSAAATSALIYGYYGGVSSFGAGTVSNFGTIYGVLLYNGGRITNGSATSTSALIIGGSTGVSFYGGGSGTVTNFGTIIATSNNVPVSGDGTGVSFHGNSGTVTNFGTISGGVEGVSIGAGTVTNFGTISGGQDGVVCAGGTVTNFGTISGGSSGAAVQNAGKVVVERGAVFIGSVLGGGEIDFVAGGVADVSNVSGFVTIGLSNGRHHTLTLTGANFPGAEKGAITIDDGNAGNTVTAATLPAKDRIIVHAGAGLDKLTGGGGNDVFYTGGDTVMTGKTGKNEFIFSAPGGNTVGDFAVSATNKIVFSDQGFSLGLSGASGTPKALPADLFVENSGGHFTSTSQRFAYATGTGDLSYSASGSNGTPALVSHLTGAPSLAATQLFFIA